MNKDINDITPTRVMQITNILRLLGLNTSLSGTKLINITIQYIINNNIEFITLQTIYKEISKKYGYNIHTIRSNINLALTYRDDSLSIKNFEKIFGYEYYEKNFEPKIFIEEVSALFK